MTESFDAKGLWEKLRYVKEPRYPKELIQQVRDHREEMIPLLMEELDVFEKEFEEILDEENYFGIVYALYILAQFRYKPAYPKIVSILEKDPNDIEEYFDSILTEGLAPILASVYDGDSSPIKRLIENPNVNEWVRVSSVNALLTLQGKGEIKREDLLDYYRFLAIESLEREPSYLWDTLVDNCLVLYPENLKEDLEWMIEEMCIDEWKSSKENNPLEIFELEMEEAFRVNEKYRRHERFVEDIEYETKGLVCFDEDNDDYFEDEYEYTAPIKSLPKPGRNDPCPCGSGKKFKKCCMKN